MNPDPPSSQIGILTTIRAAAVCIVLVSHYSNTTGIFDRMLGAKAGQFGVMLFFLLSSYLITYLYIRKPCAGKNIRQYLVARAARVGPLYLLMVMISYLALTFFNSTIFFNVSDGKSFIEHLLLLKANGLFWTIPPEVHYYLLFILIWALFSCSRWLTALIILAALITVSAGQYSSFEGNWLGMEYRISLLPCLPFFLAGTLIALIGHHARIPDAWKSQHWALLLLLIPLMYPRIYSRITGGDSHKIWQEPWVLIAMASIFAGVVLFSPARTIYSNSLTNFVGKISFSLYLLHMPVLKLMSPIILQHPEAGFPVFIAASMLVSWISFVLIERPARRSLRALGGT